MVTTRALAYDPSQSQFRDDPYPLYRVLREQNPVHFSEAIGGWAVTRYDDVLSLLRDPRLSSVRGPRALRRFMVFTDPPEHTALRSLVSKAFSPRGIEALRGTVTVVVDALLDRAAARGGMDVVADFAHEIPVAVVGDLLGVDPADRPRVGEWSRALAAGVDLVVGLEARERASAALAEMTAYFGRLLADVPRAGLLADLPSAGDDVVTTCALLLFAGYETTVNLIANGVLTLLRHPDTLARLRGRPALMRTAVEELARYESPAQAITRVAKEDIDIRDRRIAAGDTVALVLGSANRDSDAFQSPDALDVERRDNRHVAFGSGIHFCLGAPLARLECDVALTRVLARFRWFGPISAVVEWGPTMFMRGPARLDVELEAAPRERSDS